MHGTTASTGSLKTVRVPSTACAATAACRRLRSRPPPAGAPAYRALLRHRLRHVISDRTELPRQFPGEKDVRLSGAQYGQAAQGARHAQPDHPQQLEALRRKPSRLYHATLLHTFYTTFKVNRLDMDGGIILSDDKWHHISFSQRATLAAGGGIPASSGVHAANYDSALAGPGLLELLERVRRQHHPQHPDRLPHAVRPVHAELALPCALLRAARRRQDRAVLDLSSDTSATRDEQVADARHAEPT